MKSAKNRYKYYFHSTAQILLAYDNVKKRFRKYFFDGGGSFMSKKSSKLVMKNIDTGINTAMYPITRKQFIICLRSLGDIMPRKVDITNKDIQSFEKDVLPEFLIGNWVSDIKNTASLTNKTLFY